MKRDIPHFEELNEGESKEFTQIYVMDEPYWRWGSDKEKIKRTLLAELGMNQDDLESFQVTGEGRGSLNGGVYILEGHIDTGHLVAKLLPYLPSGARWNVRNRNNDRTNSLKYLEEKYGGSVNAG